MGKEKQEVIPCCSEEETPCRVNGPLMSWLERQFDRIQERSESRNANLVGKIDKIQETIYGNGDPGLKTRIDRVEIWMKARVWFERIILGAFVSALIVVFVALFTKGE